MSTYNLTRRQMLQYLGVSPLAIPASSSTDTEAVSAVEGCAPVQESRYGRFQDGPRSPLFEPVPIEGNVGIDRLGSLGVSARMLESTGSAPRGEVTSWGIPFSVGDTVCLLQHAPVSLSFGPVSGRFWMFMHTTDVAPLEADDSGLYPAPRRGEGRLREHVADYVVLREDGAEVRLPIRRRHEIGMFQRVWGANCVEAVAHHKPFPVRPHHEQESRGWGWSQTHAAMPDAGRWVNWIWAWENPDPEKAIVGFRLEPVSGPVLLSAISAGDVGANPLRWQSRRKAILRLPDGAEFDPTLDEHGLLRDIQLDLGQVISASPLFLYPDDAWADSYNNKPPDRSSREVLVEYTAHSDARFWLADGSEVAVANIGSEPLRTVAPATQLVKIRVVERSGGNPVPAKLHVHGETGEYLAPLDRHRVPNTAWFEDYSVDYANWGGHFCTYIPGETTIRLPVGKVYVEVSKGFEIRPIRKVLEVQDGTEELTIEIPRVLRWRDRGWVSADTHVHFLSPNSALIEGAGEGVNVVNLLASQWGELMTNVGDFDGKSTHGSVEAGGDGEYLVRVGTENRQHVMGHISLLGYEGGIIVPMTTGGPNESALGDPVDVLLTEWARQCKQQNGVVVLPHYPMPRLENAASIVLGEIDGVEMTSWGDLYSGINPYSLCDWYRFLNCGYFVAAVGGTDKMSASTAVGTVRTYARLQDGETFTYDAWKEAIRRGLTFVTYGPLVNFSVEGRPPGSSIEMPASGGTVNVEWDVASVTVPMSKVELVVNGEIREQTTVDPERDEGTWSVRIDKSSWLALLVRGHYQDRPEVIAAHTSPVMIPVAGSEFFAAADALTILEQIEGALAYIDTTGTRADDLVYRRMRLVLESAHRTLHNRMHRAGVFHEHTVGTDHPEHH
jgi:hypothetical protein